MVIFLSFLKRQIRLFFQGLVFVLMVLNQAGDFSMVLSASESTDGNRIKSLQLEPNEISLWGFNASQGFLLMGESAEGMRIDLTHQGSFSISNSQIARLDGTNQIVALQDGVIILRMLTSSYSGTTTGSPVVTTDGASTVLQFNGDGTYTA